MLSSAVYRTLSLISADAHMVIVIATVTMIALGVDSPLLSKYE